MDASKYGKNVDNMFISRNDLAAYFRELGFKIGAEIGVLKGKYSEVLCLANPGLKLYCVDSWGLGENKRKEYHLRSYEKAKKRLAPFNATLIHKFSMDAVKDFEDESLDFVYIDANHSYEFVRDDINVWSKKVRKGGIISGHDYDTDRIRKAVDEYVNSVNAGGVNITGFDYRGISWWFVKNMDNDRTFE